MTPAQAAAVAARERSGDQRDTTIAQGAARLNISQELLKLRRLAFDAKTAGGTDKDGRAKNPDAVYRAIGTVTNSENTYRSSLERMRPKPRLTKDGWVMPAGAQEAFDAKAPAINALIRDAQATKAKLLESVGMKPNPDGKGGYVPLTGKVDATRSASPVVVPRSGAGSTFRSPALQAYLSGKNVKPSAPPPNYPRSDGNPVPAAVPIHHAATQPRATNGKFKAPAPASATHQRPKSTRALKASF
ncbi:MAG: hypothetical protein V4671_23145 [Armatimonadota bacterium]